MNRLATSSLVPSKVGIASSQVPLPQSSGSGSESLVTGDSFSPSQNSSFNPSGKELWTLARTGFADWDNDKNGYLTDSEVESALKNPNLSTGQRATLETLRGRQVKLQKASNDEWFRERSGTTLKDIEAFRTAGDGEAARLEEQYGVELGLLNEPQEVKDNALAQRDRPADLSDRIGTRDYYLERYKDFRRRNPSEKAPDYYLNYGLKYFDRFHAQKGALKEDARQWVDKTGVALQQAMEARNGNPQSFAALERDPKRFKSFAYASHPEAYISSGLQNVSYGDRIKIGMTPDAEDLFTTDGLKQAVETGVTVIGQDLRNIAVLAGGLVANLP